MVEDNGLRQFVLQPPTEDAVLIEAEFIQQLPNDERSKCALHPVREPFRIRERELDDRLLGAAAPDYRKTLNLFDD